jgi:fructose-1,6-bisphosphatase/inositol monophosphatase family enzyme
MLNHLEKMFAAVRQYVWSEGYQQKKILGKNPKVKDVSAQFDIGAENAAIEYCRKNKLPVKILTEEQGEVNLVSGQPEYLFIFDPVDGSTNFKKGIEGSAFCVAVLPYQKNSLINPAEVKYALIGSLVSGGICKGEKNKGAYYKGPFTGFIEKPARGTLNEELNTACIEIDLDFALDESSALLDSEKGSKISRIIPLIYPARKIKHIRRNGSAAMGLMGVSTGAIDSYIDARDISTPENWIGAYLLIKEAGGEFTDIKGNELKEVKDMLTPYSYVATGNKVLHSKILKLLNG